MFEVECPQCDRTVTKETQAEAEELVESHNEQRHGGENVAIILGEKDPLTSFVDVIDDPHKTESVFHAHRNNGHYRVMCPECERLDTFDEKSEAWASAQKHNEYAHQNEEPQAGIIEEDLQEESDRKFPLIDGPSIVELVAEINDKRTVVTPDNLPIDD